MENFTELILQDNQIGLIFVPIYIFNQRIEEISTEVKQLEKKQGQDEYLTIEFFAYLKRIEKKKQDLQKLIENEENRKHKLEEKIFKIVNFYQNNLNLFNLSFIVWQHPMDPFCEMFLKKSYKMVAGPEAIFELTPRLGWNLKNQKILTSYQFLMDLTIHQEKKLNLVFLPENETIWFKYFIKPIRDLNKKLIKAKIENISITILNF